MSTKHPHHSPSGDPSSTAVGTSFELRTGALYRLLGYHVEHNVQLHSRQCDLLCEKHEAGAPPVKLLVECKYRTASSVPKVEVTAFISEYETLRLTHGLTAAVVVTNTTFTAETRALYKSRSDILLTTEGALNDDLLNATTSLRHYSETYKDEPIYKIYIPLRDENDGDLFSWLASWLKSPEPLAVLLGDFGTGKTTFLLHAKYLLAERYLRGESSLIPFYLRLRDFTRNPDITAFIRSQLLIEFGRSDVTRLNHLFAQGRMLMMLDGFDEMGKHSNTDARMAFFRALAPIFTRSAKYIITCRPSYFITAAEIVDVFGQMQAVSPRELSLLPRSSSLVSQERRAPFSAFEHASTNWTAEPGGVVALGRSDIIYKRLSSLSSADVDEYLQKREAEIISPQYPSWTAIRNKIRYTYDLEDLSRRPILLNLIVATLPKISDSIEPSPSVIYSCYTSAWLNHDYSKGEVRWLVDKESKLLFTSALAYHMYLTDTLRIHYTELPAEIAAFFDIKDPIELSYLATDIQGSSFLRGDGQEFFEFAHKSFSEYFTAVYLRNKLREGGKAILNKRLIPPEILFFLGDFVYVEPELRAQVQAEFDKHKNKKGRGLLSLNLFNILGYSRGSLSNGKVELRELPRLTFSHCAFLEFIIQFEILDLCLQFCRLQSCHLIGMENLLTLKQCDILDTTLTCSLKDRGLFHCDIVDSTLRSMVIGAPGGEVVMSGCRIRKSYFGGERTWDLLESIQPALRAEQAASGQLVLRERLEKGGEGAGLLDVRIIDCQVEASCFENIVIGSQDFPAIQHCQLIGVIVIGLDDELYKQLSVTNLVFKDIEIAAEVEKRAQKIIERCIPPETADVDLRRAAGMAVDALSDLDRLMLAWVLGVTKSFWAERELLPLKPIEAFIVEGLVNALAARKARSAKRR